MLEGHFENLLKSYTKKNQKTVVFPLPQEIHVQRVSVQSQLL
jgi:hypothetical protein